MSDDQWTNVEGGDGEELCPAITAVLAELSLSLTSLSLTSFSLSLDVRIYLYIELSLYV